MSTQQGTVADVAAHILEKRQEKPTEAEETQVEEVEEVEDHEDNLEDDPTEGEGDQPEAEELSSADEEEPETLSLEDLEGYDVRIPVKVRGEEIEVTLEEAISGYQRDQDYRKKTTEISEERKALEEERQSIADLNQLRGQYVEGLETLEKVLAKPFSDEQLAKIKEEKGFEAYMEAKDQNDQFASKVSSIRAEKEKTVNQVTEEQKREYEKFVRNETAALERENPELLTDEGSLRLSSYLSSMGYTDDQISSTVDHRLFVMAEKARKFDELQEKGIKKTIKKPPKVIKKKSSTGKQTQAKELSEAQKQAQSTGNTKDIAKLLLAKRKSKRK